MAARYRSQRSRRSSFAEYGDPSPRNRLIRRPLFPQIAMQERMDANPESIENYVLYGEGMIPMNYWWMRGSEWVGHRIPPHGEGATETGDSLNQSQIDSYDRKIKELLAIIEALKKENANKQRLIDELEERLRKKEVGKAKEAKKETEKRLEAEKLYSELNSAMEDKLKHIEDITGQYESTLAKLTESHSEALADKDREIHDKDDVIRRLKKQLADTMGNSSSQRQSQIDELTKIISKLQEDIEILKLKLNSIKGQNKSGQCKKCLEMQDELDFLYRRLKTKDIEIDDLKSKFTKCEKVLQEQEELIKMFGERTGQRIVLSRHPARV